MEQTRGRFCSWVEQLGQKTGWSQ